jgi:YwiC-like protein
VTGAVRAAATASLPASRRRHDRVVPDQHGAWAFLALPLALAMARTGWFALLPAVALAWVAAYPLSWAATGRLTARRPERFDHALMTWAPIALLAGLPLLVARPWLVWVMLGYAGLWLVSLSLARVRRERSLANDLVLVAECTLMIPVTVGIGAVAPGWSPPYGALDAQLVLPVVACLVALTGSVLHVKSLIRERRNARFALASRAFAVAAVFVVALAAASTDRSLWVVLPFAGLAARTWLVHGPWWRPARLGLLELAGLIAVVVGVALA